MAFSREPMIGSTSRNRRRTTGYTNPYAEAAAARSAQRSTPQRYANPFAGQPANQPPQDPLVSAIAGGSTGGGFDDTVTPTGINTNAPGAFQEQTQGKTASGGAVPFNQPPPPPPPPPPPTMAQMQAPQTQNRALPQGGMTSDQYQQVLRMNNQPTGNAYDPNAGNAMALAQTAQRPANQPFNDLVTPTGISTEVATSAPRDLPTMAEAQASQPSMTADDYRNILRGEIAGIGSGAMTADEYGRLSRGMEDRLTQAIGGQMTADDYQSMLRGETQGIRDSMMTADDYRNVLRGELTARDEQARQAEIAAEQERQRQQAGLDMQRAQAAQVMNDRTRELLQGYGGGTPAQRDMMMAQAPTFQQQELLRRAESRLQAPSGATDAQAAMFAAQRPTELPDVSGFRSSYADAAAAQGGGGATPTGYTNPYADAAARQPDAGLRTADGRPQFQQRMPQLGRLANPGGSLQQRLEQEYLGRIDSADDPILASQIADQQLRQQEAQKGLVEQLSRYGVLRGGGDTAAALTRMAEGDERNRLALEAAAAQRRQGDLRDALAFDQARSSMNIAQRGQGLEERLAQDRLLDSALARDVTRAGQTGQFQGMDTLAAQEQRQRMDIAERGQTLEERLGGETIQDRQQGRDIAAAELTGRFGDADTLAGRELALREDLSRRGDLRAQQAAESELFGRVITGAEAPITTLEGQRAASDLDTAGLAREATEAGLTGQFRGGATATERALESQLASDELARQIQEAGVTGQYGGEDTLQSQVIESSLQNEALNRALSRAGATGLFREEGDTGTGTETLESRLRTAGLTGRLDDGVTLAGRQAEMDQVGAILAALDPELEGRSDALAEALISRLGEEYGDVGIQDALTRELVNNAGGMTDREFEEFMNNDSVSESLKQEVLSARNAALQEAGLLSDEERQFDERLARFTQLMNNTSISDEIKRQYREQLPELAAAFDQGRG